jgi:hypothetical protein
MHSIFQVNYWPSEVEPQAAEYSARDDADISFNTSREMVRATGVMVSLVSCIYMEIAVLGGTISSLGSCMLVCDSCPSDALFTSGGWSN